MGLDLHELNIPWRLRPLYQAGVQWLLPTAPPQPVSEPSQDEEPVPEPEPTEPTLPQPWSQMWSRLSPPHTMVWTYWHLAEDLGPRPSPERRRLLQTILTSLRLPKGSVAFWPLSAYDGQHQVDRSLFWYGVQASRAQTLVIFGTQAFSALFPEHEARFGISYAENGLCVAHVPDPADMLPDDREMKKLTWKILNSLQGPSG